jgi:hypothetical protein
VWIPLLYVGARLRLVSALGLNVLGTGIGLADLLWFRFYHDLPSLSDIDGMWQVGLASGSLLTLSRPTDLLAVTDLVLAATCGALFPRTPDHARTWSRPVAVGLLLAASLTAAAPVLVIARQDPDEVFEYAFQ